MKLPGERIEVSYRILARPEEARTIARGIAVEQTVEVPESLIPPEIEAAVVGRIESLGPDPKRSGAQLARISYSPELAGGQLPQLLNLIYGNTAMHRGIRVTDLHLPTEVLDGYHGPRFGIEGLRRMVGVWGRPLLASALKPNGAPTEHFVELARGFAAGGGEIIKDDQNLIDPNYEAWHDRVARCQDAVVEANEQHGGRCLYFPWVGGPFEEAERKLAALLELGVKGYLVGPFLMGLEAARTLAERYPLATMAHPSLSGPLYVSRDEGMEAGLVLGTLMRLVGMDISVYVNIGGRFKFSREDCIGVAERCREELGALRACFPSPAGGMHLGKVQQMAEDYGADSCLLIGGALLGHGENLAESTRHFLDTIREHFDERREEPKSTGTIHHAGEPSGSAATVDSACERPGSTLTQRALSQLTHNGEFAWKGREFVDYKLDQSLPFSGVRRLELIGSAGEATAFELRYFELEPGGFTSLERHRHTHTLIGVRGRGIVVEEGDRRELQPFDVAFVDQHHAHQLRNESDRPFGFFCIVDRKRDRPKAP